MSKPNTDVNSAPIREPAVLDRAVFRTSRLLDFCSEKELILQTGHQPADWPLVVLKELVDNALDACEESEIPPEITVTVDGQRITVADNGPGIALSTIQGVVDFTTRVSSRDAYVSPTRGAQGNALKTILAMPFVLDGSSGVVEIGAHGVKHRVTMGVDRIRQEPVVELVHEDDTNCKKGTTVAVLWPNSSSSIIFGSRSRFLQIAESYVWMNPHMTLTVVWNGNETRYTATAPDWAKWSPREPTSPHWYGEEHLRRLIAAYISHDQDRKANRTVREFVAEFRGFKGSAKQKAVLDATSMSRTNLSDLAVKGEIDVARTDALLTAMKTFSRQVKPKDLGIIGGDHIWKRMEAAGAHADTYDYKLIPGETDGVPFLIEAAFAVNAEGMSGGCGVRRIVTGVNWSPGIVNPFRELGTYGGLDALLSKQYSSSDEPVIVFLHMACARVEYADRGKSAVVLRRAA
jgi:DNA topoisomerase VI subunit B